MTKSQSDSTAAPCFDFRSMPFSSGKPPASEGEADACALFQPLYHPCGENEKSDAEESEKDPAVLLENARRKGMHDGLQSGREEAAEISGSSLRPALRDYAQAIDALCTLNGHVQDNVSENIIELALSIARQILGEDIGIAAASLSELKNEFGHALIDVNRFSLKMHPEDIDHLRETLAADDGTWPDHPGIRIEADPSLQPGDIGVAEHSSREALSNKIKEALGSVLAGLD